MRVLENAQQMIDMLRVPLKEWAHFKGYQMPTTAWFVKHTFEFHDVKSWTAWYGKSQLEAIGSHDGARSIIKVATRWDVIAVYSTLIHELAHAIQFYNLGARFSELYSHESLIKAHSDNKFENEARNASVTFKQTIARDTKYGRRIAAFSFKFKQKAPARPSIMTMEREWGRDYNDYNNTKAFKCNRNAWWLRRQYGVC